MRELDEAVGGGSLRLIQGLSLWRKPFDLLGLTALSADTEELRTSEGAFA